MQSYPERIRQEGEQAGIQTGEANMLLLLLQQKFGKIPDTLRQCIQQVDPDTLLRWSGHVLTEDSIDAVIR